MLASFLSGVQACLCLWRNFLGHLGASLEVGQEDQEEPVAQMVRRGERVLGILGHLSLTHFLCSVGLVVFPAALEAHALAGLAARVPEEATSDFCRQVAQKSCCGVRGPEAGADVEVDESWENFGLRGRLGRCEGGQLKHGKWDGG